MNVDTEKELRRLRFSGHTEREFQDEYSRRSRSHIRFVCLLALFLVTVYGLTELPLDPDLRIRQWLVRYAVVCPVILAVTVFSFTPAFPRYEQSALGFASLVLGLGAVASFLSAPHPEYWLHVNLVFLIMCVYTLVKLRFLYATVISWALIATYLTAALIPDSPLRSDLPIALRHLLLANLFGMIAGYSMELYIRRDFLLTRMLRAERRKSDQLLANILPRPIIERLKDEPGTIADSFAEVTVLFADIVDFTPLCSNLPPGELVGLLTRVFSVMDRLADQHGLEKIKTVGDAYMAVSGLPIPRADHAEAAAEFALDVQEAISRLEGELGQPLILRVGINTGPVVAGIIGTRRFIYDLWGDAVNLASRMASQGVAGGIQVSASTYARLRESYHLENRGQIPIKGKGQMDVYLLLGPRDTARESRGSSSPPASPPLFLPR